MPVVAYLKSVFDREGNETKIFALNPKRPNLVVRLRGNGKKRPVLIMGHTDVVSVDPRIWLICARGMQCYGVGEVVDLEDGPKGFGAHSAVAHFGRGIVQICPLPLGHRGQSGESAMIIQSCGRSRMSC